MNGLEKKEQGKLNIFGSQKKAIISMMRIRKAESKMAIFFIIIIIASIAAAFWLFNHKIIAAKEELIEQKKQFSLYAKENYIEVKLESLKGEFEAELLWPSDQVELRYEKAADKKSKGRKSMSTNQMARQSADGRWAVVWTLSPAEAGEYKVLVKSHIREDIQLSLYQPLFADLAHHWSEKAVEQFYRLGIVSGTGNGKFSPDQAISQAAFIKMVVLGLSKEEGDYYRWSSNFITSIKNEQLGRELSWQQFLQKKTYEATREKIHWSVPYYKTAKLLGIHVEKQKEQKNLSKQTVFSRAQAAALLLHILKLQEGEGKDTGIPSFMLQHISSQSYHKAVEHMVRLGIMNGYSDGSLKPEKELTRAEAVQLVSKFFEQMEKR